MAEAVVGPLVGKLQELAASEAHALAEVGDQIRVLRDQLVWLQAFIREADPQRRSKLNELVCVWVQQTRDVAFDVEDAVDQYFLELDVSRFPDWVHDAARLFHAVVTQIRVRHDLSRRIAVIKERIESISTNRKKYKLNDVKVWSATWVAASSASALAPAWDDVDGSIIGRDNEITELKTKLLGTNQNITVLTILGESGIGKTTVTKKALNEEDIKKHFKIRSHTFLPPYSSSDDILDQIHQDLSQECGGDTIRQQLHDKLKEKPFVLVVDGAISTTNWKVLLSALPNNQNGSRVVLTAKLEDQSSHQNMNHDLEFIKLHPLGKDDCKRLFLRKMFGTGEKKGDDSDENQPNNPMDPKSEFYNDVFDQEKFYDDVCKITGGSPLGIVLLSGLLRTKEYPDEWISVVKQLKRNKKDKRLKRILSLSFDDLPHQLKSCLLYVPAMCENGLLNAQRLVRLWIAEGFIRPEKGKTMEEVAQDYLKELIFRGLVHLEQKDECCNVRYVSLHNFIYTFVQSEAREANFLEVHDTDEVITPAAVRRLALQNYRDKYVPISNCFPKLRSILCHFEEDTDDPSEKMQKHTLKFVKSSQFLRVIDLRGLKLAERLPNEIGDLLHLRYLGLKTNTLKRLPQSVGNLRYLQTLDIRDSGVERLPDPVWRILELRHVLSSTPIELPRNVGDLKHLQTLECVFPGTGWAAKECPLHNMMHLRSVNIQRLAEAHKEPLSASLKKLKYLAFLKLSGDVLPADMFTCEGFESLRVMELNGKLDLGNEGSPSQEDDIQRQFILPNLTRLTMMSCSVDQDFIDRLGKMLALTNLQLMKNSYNDKSNDQLVFCSGGFPSLKCVKLAHFKFLKNLTIENSAMEKIEQMIIEGTFAKDLHLIYSDVKIKNVIEAMQSTASSLQRPKVTYQPAIPVEASTYIVGESTGCPNVVDM